MSGQLIPFRNKTPQVHPDAWVAPNAVLIGDVVVEAGAGIWYGCVLRGDMQRIHIGENSNIQDGTVIHVSYGSFGTRVGKNVTVGHCALLHACTVQDGGFVGMHATALDGSVIESGSMLAGGAMLTAGKRVPAGELWAGNPAQKMRDIRDKDLQMFEFSWRHYHDLALTNMGKPNELDDDPALVYEPKFAE
jgi:carbonic anhydrase/acetyltransferase-like protein (isoleucine patch superfamily)